MILHSSENLLPKKNTGSKIISENKIGGEKPVAWINNISLCDHGAKKIKALS